MAPLSRREFLQVSAASLATPALVAAREKGETVTAAGYVLQRLAEHEVRVLFGVPGATCDPLFAAARAAGLSPVVTASDLEAGYAADAYARLRGLGAVAVTYGVGTMSLLPAIAGAYAERSPVVVVNGGPSAEDLRLLAEDGTLFSHSTGREKTDLAMFREVTAFAERAERAADVPRVVDGALRAALGGQRPAYVEIPKHLWEARCPAPEGTIDATVAPSGLEEGLAKEILDRLGAAARPAVLLGIELLRYRLSAEVAALVQRLGVPWATTMLAKSVLPEQTPGFAGVYGGEHSVPSVKKLVEESDGLLTLGCVMGRQYRGLVSRSGGAMMQVANHAVRVGKRPWAKAALRPLIAALGASGWKADPGRLAAAKLAGLSFDQRRASLPAAKPAPAPGDQGLGYDEVLRAVSEVLDASFLAITDTSLSMYPAAELNVVGERAFLCNAVWQSIGYSVAAAVGAGLAQARRPLVVCGDGGFQMTAQALSTLARQKIRAIVVVLDNGEYGIEQWLLEPGYFQSGSSPLKGYLALNRWRYADLAKALGFEFARTAETAGDLRRALAEAKAAPGPALISAVLAPRDLPSELKA